MKLSLRLLTLLLTVCVLFSMSSCISVLRFSGLLGADGQSSTVETEAPDEPVVLPENTPLVYTLTDADRIAFEEQLALCRTLTLEGIDTAAIEAGWEQTEAMYYAIATQAQIAYILYCTTQSDKTLSDNHLYASKTVSEVYEEYMKVCREIDESESPYREEFFSDWSEQELDEMRRYSGELSILRDENERILVSYRELSEEAFYEGAASAYLQLAENLNRMAELQGYENYYDYAYTRVYLRDYGQTEIAALRGYTREYLIPLYLEMLMELQQTNATLSREKQRQLEALLYANYDSAGTNYVNSYLAALPEKTAGIMSEVLLSENAIFTTREDSHNGAFTTMLYSLDRAFCFFGPSYQSAATVVHEMGHYYASGFGDGLLVATDLAEVHSQGNEMLFYSHLRTRLDADVYDAFIDYQMCYMLMQIILCVVIDEFEMQVYRNASDMTDPVREMDALMDAVLENYGGAEFFSTTIADAHGYWRHVVLESPVYYISYAVSGIASAELYASAEADFSEAARIYCSLVEQTGEDARFLAALQAVGMGSPFVRETYLRMRQALKGA